MIQSHEQRAYLFHSDAVAINQAEESGNEHKNSRRHKDNLAKK